jgi:hypothetical protein
MLINNYEQRNSDHQIKMYLGLLLRLLWDTFKIHAKCQDTCILFECNRACKIHLRYIRYTRIRIQITA